MSSFLFIMLAVVAVSMAAFSFLSYQSYVNVAFPLRLYILAHACVGVIGLLVFRLRLLSVVSCGLAVVLLMVTVNFAIAHFRGAFFSHFEAMPVKIIVCLLFVCGGITILRIIDSFFGEDDYTWEKKTSSGALMTMLIVYFCLLSPFYFVEIEATRSGAAVLPKAYEVDGIYEVTDEMLNVDVAPREAARRYFMDGKQHAAKGTWDGYAESIKQYLRALEIVPGFSTACAEIAYSVTCMSRIEREIGFKEAKVEADFAKASQWVEKAIRINERNPHNWGIRTIVEHFTQNEVEAKRSLERARELSDPDQGGGGYTDRILQAMAILSKSNLRSVEYLLAVLKINPNDAEIHNLLGLQYYRINNDRLAKEMFERSIRLSPGFGKPYLNMALVMPKERTSDLCVEAYSNDWTVEPIAMDYLYLLQQIESYNRIFLIVLAGIVIITFLLAFNGKRQVMVVFVLLAIAVWYVSWEVYIHTEKNLIGFDYMFKVGFPFS